jgi:hypothetical protein
MKREDIEKLLGGYATGTLTGEERQALFEAALSDQALFEALAGEEALKELLQDPHCRQEIEQALRDQPCGFLERVTGWMRQPRVWALAGTLAVTAVLVLVVIRTQAPTHEFELAQRQPPPAQIAATPAPQQQPAPAIAGRPALPSAPRQFASPAAMPAAQSAPAEPAPPASRSEAVARLAPVPVAQNMPAAAPPEVARADRLTAPAPPPPAPPPAVAQSTPAAPAPMTAAAPPPAVFKVAKQQPGTAGGGKGLVVAHDAAKSVIVTAESSAVDKKVKDAELKSGTSMTQNQRQAALQLNYKILAQGRDGRFAEANPRIQNAAGAPLRVNLQANQAGYLYVNGARGVLLATQAMPGANYLVHPRPEDRKLTVILSRYPVVIPPPARALARSSRAKEEPSPDDRVVVEIDLNRP